MGQLTVIMDNNQAKTRQADFIINQVNCKDKYCQHAQTKMNR